MKKLFALLMSFQLILSPLAMAKKPDTSEVDKYREEGTGSRDGKAFYIKQATTLVGTGLGIGMVGCTAQGWMTLSHYIFMAGGVAMFASEMAGAIANNKYYEGKAKELKFNEEKVLEDIKDKPQDEQEKTLRAAMELEDHNLTFMKNRKTWHEVVKYIYLAASIWALAERIVVSLPTPYNMGYTEDGLNCTSMTTGKVAIKAILAVIMLAPEIVKQIGRGSQGTHSGGNDALLGVSMVAMAAIVTLLYDQMANNVDMLVGNSVKRIITFGGFNVLVGQVGKGLEERLSAAESNIALLESMLPTRVADGGLAIAGAGSGADYTPPTGGGYQAPPGSAAAAPKGLPTAQAPRSCVGMSGNAVSYSEKSCSKPLKLNRPIPNVNIPVLQNVAANSLKFSDAMARGDMAAATIHGDAIIGQGAALNRLKGELEAKLNQTLKDQGKPTIDFDKEVKNQLASFAAQAGKIAAANGMGDMASAGNAKLDEAVPSQNKSQDVTTASTAPVAAPPAAGGDLLFDSENVEEFGNLGSAAKDEQSLDDFESSEQDILKTPEVSIFKQLSNRYILNYMKIFERKKAPEAAEAAEDPPKE